MKELDFDLSRMASRGQLFPDGIERDPWVLFHGTHGVWESEIESSGLTPGVLHDEKFKYNLSKLSSLNDVIMDINSIRPQRAGKSTHILSSYSLEDIAAGCPICLSTFSSESTKYAHPENLGGEVMSGFCNAYSYIIEIITGFQEGSSGTLPPVEDWPDEVFRAALWFKENEPWASKLYSSLMKLQAMNGYSTVYALKFTEHTILEMENTEADEVKCFRTIKPEEIISKIQIPNSFFEEYSKDPRMRAFLEDREFERKVLDEKRKGVLKAIRENKKLRDG